MPALTSMSEEGASPSPHIPARRESSKSLVISSEDDESIKRRNEIMTKASAERQSSLKNKNNTPSPIGKCHFITYR